MDIKFIDALHYNLEGELIALGTGAELYAARLAAISIALKALKEHVLSDGFRDDEDEVYFFKYLKPRFYMLYIYEVELYNLISGVPVGTDEMVWNYYLSELSALKRFFSQHSFIYDYFAREEEGMDGSFFLRRNLNVLHPDVSASGFPGISDDGFTTNQDYNFSKFRALEKLRDFILGRIRLVYVKPEPGFPLELALGKKLNWTGEKVELVELAYGIFLSKSINGGKLEIADVVSWLEQSLNVDLGVPYRKFISIGRRKNLSYTKYLDGMRIKIVDYISEKNSYVPKAFRPSGTKPS